MPSAVGGDHADDRAAGELVDRLVEPAVLLEGLAELPQRLAEPAGHRRVGIARRLEQAGAAVLPQAVRPSRSTALLAMISFFQPSTLARISGS